MVKSVQNVINAIQMIYSVSLYYNTSEKISALFIKVSVLYSVSEKYELCLENLRIQFTFNCIPEKFSRSQIRWLQHAGHILLTTAHV